METFPLLQTLLCCRPNATIKKGIEVSRKAGPEKWLWESLNLLQREQQRWILNQLSRLLFSRNIQGTCEYWGQTVLTLMLEVLFRSLIVTTNHIPMPRYKQKRDKEAQSIVNSRSQGRHMLQACSVPGSLLEAAP